LFKLAIDRNPGDFPIPVLGQDLLPTLQSP
jgi:hypothetical protein